MPRPIKNRSVPDSSSSMRMEKTLTGIMRIMLHRSNMRLRTMIFFTTIYQNKWKGNTVNSYRESFKNAASERVGFIKIWSSSVCVLRHVVNLTSKLYFLTILKTYSYSPDPTQKKMCNNNILRRLHKFQMILYFIKNEKSI